MIVFNKGHVQLHTLGVPEFGSAREESHSRLCGRSQGHGTGDTDGTETPGCEIGVEEANHVIAGQEAGGIAATKRGLVRHVGVAFAKNVQ